MGFIVQVLITYFLLILPYSNSAPKNPYSKLKERYNRVSHPSQTDLEHGPHLKPESAQGPRYHSQLAYKYLDNNFCLFSTISDEGNIVYDSIRDELRILSGHASDMGILDEAVVRIILKSILDSSTYIIPRIHHNTKKLTEYKLATLTLINFIKKTFEDIKKTHSTQMDFITSVNEIKNTLIWRYMFYLCWEIDPDSELWTTILNKEEKFESVVTLIGLMFGKKAYDTFVTHEDVVGLSEDHLNTIQKRLFKLRLDIIIIGKFDIITPMKNLIFLLSVLNDANFEIISSIIMKFYRKIAAEVVKSVGLKMFGKDGIMSGIIAEMKNAKGYSEESIDSLHKSARKLQLH